MRCYVFGCIYGDGLSLTDAKIVDHCDCKEEDETVSMDHVAASYIVASSMQ